MGHTPIAACGVQATAPMAPPKRILHCSTDARTNLFPGLSARTLSRARRQPLSASRLLRQDRLPWLPAGR